MEEVGNKMKEKAERLQPIWRNGKIPMNVCKAHDAVTITAAKTCIS